MRIEMSVTGMTSVTILDLDTKIMYTYLPAQNMAVKASYDQASKLATQEASSITDFNPKNLGTESIDGIVCQVFEYNIDGNKAKQYPEQGGIQS